MDIAPVYELKARLRAAAIAGTNLLSEDFRLKKAAESFAPMAAASPVFAKINEMTTKLLNDGSPENLLDTITLVDAVITTLGAVDVQGELEDIPVSESGMVIVNAPYSQLSAILGALTESGGGQYNTFIEMKENYPELLNDYRVKPAMVKGLGAPYSELADEVAATIGEMGAEMLPLLKNGFDPKGKKEMLRRLSVIERIAGAQENDFYLEQLENAEKDIRKRLIYALRHDEKNIDKLFELVKTEKGNSKTAAISALASFDNEKAGACVEEYAKKKPAEALKLMDRVSSEWSSEFTARLIERVLTDKDGNKVTLTRAADIDNIRLKDSLSFWDITGALTGKFGESIERIYRDFDNKNQSKFTDTSKFMDNALGDSIIKTGNDGLKKLAAELNNRPETKGQYVYAEAVTRLLGEDDCSKWFEKQVGAIYDKKLINSQSLISKQIIKAIWHITYENGVYSVVTKCYDSILDMYLPETSAPINQSMIEALTDIFIKYPSIQFDSMIANWADPNDRKYCEKLANVFVDHAVDKELGFIISLSHLRKLGVGNIKGIALKYLKNHPDTDKWSIRRIFTELNGDRDYWRAEVNEVIGLLREGKLKTAMSKDQIEDFAVWAESQPNYYRDTV